MRLHVWLAVGTEELETRAEVVDVDDNPWQGGIASFTIKPSVALKLGLGKRLTVTIEPVPETPHHPLYPDLPRRGW
jgi:hypothetical protein